MLDQFFDTGRFLARRLILKLQRHPRFLQQVLAVPGELTPAEAQLLYGLAQQVRDGSIVEIGSNNGRSTVALALGSQVGNDAAVFAIEPHEHFVGVLGGEFGPQNRKMFFQTMVRTGCYRTVRLINTSSEVIAPGWAQPVALLWIDGDHRYEAVWRDVRAWLPHLLPDAWIAFHDSIDPSIGPNRVVKELLAGGGYGQIGITDSITLLQRQS